MILSKSLHLHASPFPHLYNGGDTIFLLSGVTAMNQQSFEIIGWEALDEGKGLLL